MRVPTQAIAVLVSSVAAAAQPAALDLDRIETITRALASGAEPHAIPGLEQLHPPLVVATGGADAVTVADALDRLAEALHQRSLHTLGLAVQSRALALLEEDPAHGPPSAAALRARVNLGDSLLSSGRVLDARDELWRVLPLLEARGAEGAALLPAARLNLALALSQLGDAHSARSLLLRVIAVGGDGSEYGAEARRRARWNLVEVEAELGDHGAALTIVAALREEAQAAGASARELASFDMMRATQLSALGDPTGLAVAEHAFAALSEGGGTEEALRWRGAFAAILVRAGRIDAALEHSVAASRELAQRLAPDHPALQRQRANHASVLAAHERWPEARAELELAIESVLRRLRSVDLRATQRLRELARVNRQNLVSSLLSCRASDRPDAELDAEELAAVLEVRSVVAREAELRARVRRIAAADAPTRAAVEAMFARQAELLRTAGATAAADARLRVEEASAQLAAHLAGRRELDALFRSRDLATIAELLPPDAALLVAVAYRRFSPARAEQQVAPREDRVAVFTLTHDGRAQRFEIGTAAQVDVAANAVRSASGAAQLLRGERPAPAGAAGDATWLARALEPAVTALPASARRLFVSADGAIASMPLDALPFGDGTLWLDRFEVSRCEGVDVGAEDGTTESAPGLLLVGAVEFGSGGAWPALPGSQRELEVVERAWHEGRPTAGLKVLRQEAATRAAVLAALPRAGVVHVATHAFASPRAWSAPGEAMLSEAQDVHGIEAERECGLVLANGERLLAAELGELDLSRCDLFVLSACSTDVGVRTFGNALTGVNRALHRAGVRATVCTLWPIPDDGPARLFASFYAELLRDGTGPAAALRGAKQRARAAGLPPSQWAGFVPYAPWR